MHLDSRVNWKQHTPDRTISDYRKMQKLYYNVVSQAPLRVNHWKQTSTVCSYHKSDQDLWHSTEGLWPASLTSVQYNADKTSPFGPSLQLIPVQKKQHNSTWHEAVYNTYQTKSKGLPANTRWGLLDHYITIHWPWPSNY